MSEALIPGAEDIIPRRNIAPEPEGIEEQNIEELQYASLADHPGWQIFRRQVLKRCDELERLHGLEVSKMTKDQVGEAFLIGRAAASKLRDELQNVEITAKVVHELRPKDGKRAQT